MGNSQSFEYQQCAHDDDDMTTPPPLPAVLQTNLSGRMVQRLHVVEIRDDTMLTYVFRLSESKGSRTSLRRMLLNVCDARNFVRWHCAVLHTDGKFELASGDMADLELWNTVHCRDRGGSLESPNNCLLELPVKVGLLRHPSIYEFTITVSANTLDIPVMYADLFVEAPNDSFICRNGWTLKLRFERMGQIINGRRAVKLDLGKIDGLIAYVVVKTQEVLSRIAILADSQEVFSISADVSLYDAADVASDGYMTYCIVMDVATWNLRKGGSHINFVKIGGALDTTLLGPISIMAETKAEQCSRDVGSLVFLHTMVCSWVRGVESWT